MSGVDSGSAAAAKERLCQAPVVWFRVSEKERRARIDDCAIRVDQRSRCGASVAVIGRDIAKRRMVVITRCGLFVEFEKLET